VAIRTGELACGMRLVRFLKWAVTAAAGTLTWQAAVPKVELSGRSPEHIVWAVRQLSRALLSRHGGVVHGPC
jgi:hypothetical protein